MPKAVVLVAAVFFAVVACARPVDGAPVAGPDTETSATTETTTTSTEATETPTSEAPPADSGLLALTCGEFLAMDVATQQTTAHDLAVLLDRPIAAANQNSYLLITAFCSGEPDTLVKDTLPLA